MSRKIKLTAAAACLCLIALSLTALAVVLSPVQGIPPVPSPSQTTSLFEMSENDEFIVTVLDGYVTVYLSGSPDTPIEKTEIRADSLRLADQEMLRQGVVLQGLESLSHFLEDFGP